MNTENPILKKTQYPHNAIDFSSIKPQHFLPAMQEAIDAAKAKISEIKAQTQPTFKSTIVGLEEATENTSFAYSLFYNLLLANGDDQMNQLSEKLMPLMSSFASDISLDHELFEKVKNIYDNQSSLQLDTEEVQLLKDTYQGFTRNGALLDDKGREQIRKIDEELAVLSPQFSKNATQAVNEFQLKITDSTDLAGLPDSAISSAKHLAEEKQLADTWLFTLQAPSFGPFMKYCDNRDLRKQMVTAMATTNSEGQWDNRELVLKTLKLREQRAKLLGYNNHAEYTLEKRMAETPQTVNNFLNELYEVAKPTCDKEIAELQEFVDKLGGPNPLQSWDFDYYSEKLKKEKFHFDEQELKPYFKLENVVNGVYSVASKLYDLEFKPNKELPVYHPEVEAVEIYQKNGDYIGLLYLDYFPHENKKSGAWMTSYRDQGLFDGKVHRPHISIVCNFTKPTPDHPSLLTIREVETLFHEFGHALHGLLSNCVYRSHSGPQVYWDFVELPSQIMENWVKELEALQLFAKHYETGELISETLVNKIKAVSQFHAGYNNLRQLRFAMLDMAYHTTPASEITDVHEFEDKVTEKHRLFPKIPGGNSSVSFQHIFAGGYSAGYYSYKWAEVLDADAFEMFKENGIFDPKTAQSFRKNILERGGAEHPMTLYKAFRGHEPDSKALLRRDGLL